MQQKLELSPELKRLRDSIKQFSNVSSYEIEIKKYREKLFNFIGYCATHDLVFSANDGILLLKEMGIDVDHLIFTKIWDQAREEYMQAQGIKLEHK